MGVIDDTQFCRDYCQETAKGILTSMHCIKVNTVIGLCFHEDTDAYKANTGNVTVRQKLQTD